MPSDLGNKEIFAKNLKYYMGYHELERNKLCDDLNIPPTTLSDWLNAKKYPRIDKIEMLANYFNIKKSDLIEDKYKNQPVNQQEVLFNKHKDLLSESDWAIINTIIEQKKKEIDKQLGED